MKLVIPQGATSRIVTVFIQDSSSTTGAGLGSLTNASSITGGFVREGSTGVALAVDEDVTTEGTYQAPSAQGKVRIGTPANMPTGFYELHFHNNLWATGAETVTIGLGGATNMAPLTLEIQLSDPVRGLGSPTALPNAAADAAGGLPISDAGGLDMDAMRSDVAAILVDTGTTLQGELDGIQADTEDIQSRLPAALTAGGNMKADALAISGSTTAADNAEVVYDTDFATNYDTTNDRWTVNVKTWNDLTTVALPLAPTVAGRTLDVSAGGEAGVDWANIGSPTTTVGLSGTTVKTATDVASTLNSYSTEYFELTLQALVLVDSTVSGVVSDTELTIMDGAFSNGQYDGCMLLLRIPTFPGYANALAVISTTESPATLHLDRAVSGVLSGSIARIMPQGFALAKESELAKVPKSDGSASWNATALAAINAQVVDVMATDARVAGVSIEEALRRIGALTSGIVTGAGTGTETFKDYEESASTIVITVDSSGNRSAITYN